MLAAITAVVLVALVLATVGVTLAYLRFDDQIASDVNALRTAARNVADPVVTEATLRSLPEAARRYFVFAGVVGRSIPSVVSLSQVGRIRSSASAAWMNFEAEETYSIDPPGFVWRAWFPSRRAPMVLGRDEYLGGSGTILMKALGLVPIADEHGDEMGAAGLMRFLNEAMWFPAALLRRNVTISSDDDSSFRVAMTDGAITADATLFVDADGRLVNFRARRFNTGTHSIETWETPVAEYADFNGIKLPGKGLATWKLASAEFVYIELTVTRVVYE